ncbi:MAG: non-canonical purine NTP pyrophosphatase, partial [Clostridia bacterium]|nr:non-canonical purine NTP pyrophosphatase [Clostridia bacterium]
LGGAPGVYSARYAGEHGDDLENNLLLLKNMENEKNRAAKFVCAMALAFPDGRIINVEGEFHGQIDYEMKGTGGFGYDCLFYLPEYDMTSAQISAEEKNKISHRAKALQLIKEKLNEIKD